MIVVSQEYANHWGQASLAVASENSKKVDRGLRRLKSAWLVLTGKAEALYIQPPQEKS